ncbi:hypothetical protein [Erwinia mallotivora]|uniref:hypothetical protein n=1 Tax=Erwinia mallotivora TaxID=69222 RepID=UPI0021C1500D|nr:hypothetical protein [Erwinia mallotivora]
MIIKPTLRPLARQPDDLPRFTAEASAAVMRMQASDVLCHPFPDEAGHTMPWPAEPGSGKSFLLKEVLAKGSGRPAKHGKKPFQDWE